MEARTPTNSAEANPSTPAGAAAHVIMFWVLTLMAIGLFAPCVLMPIWNDSEAIKKYEREVAGAVDSLAIRVDDNQREIQALLADPLVNERVVRRELNYRPEGEQIIRWSREELASLHLNLSELPASIPDTTLPPQPAWLVTLNRWLPAWPWDELFAQSPNRWVLLAMSGILLVTAFVLYEPTQPNAARNSR